MLRTAKARRKLPLDKGAFEAALRAVMAATRPTAAARVRHAKERAGGRKRKAAEPGAGEAAA